MKSADLSNEIREFSVAKKWADKIMKEFISQSNRESLLNLPLFLDKEKFILSSEQKNFINNLSLPLIELLSFIFPDLESCSEQMKKNLASWEQIYTNWGDNNFPEVSNTYWYEKQVKKNKDSLIDALTSQSSIPSPKEIILKDRRLKSPMSRLRRHKTTNNQKNL